MIGTFNDMRAAEEYFANKNKFTIGPVEVDGKIKEGDGTVILDVRADEDYRKGHLPGAVNLPESQWGTLRFLSRDTLNIFYCYTQTCHLASHAAQFFARQGYPVMEMEGGFEAWKEAGLQVER